MNTMHGVTWGDAAGFSVIAGGLAALVQAFKKPAQHGVEYVQATTAHTALPTVTHTATKLLNTIKVVAVRYIPNQHRLSTPPPGTLTETLNGAEVQGFHIFNVLLAIIILTWLWLYIRIRGQHAHETKKAEFGNHLQETFRQAELDVNTQGKDLRRPQRHLAQGAGTNTHQARNDLEGPAKDFASILNRISQLEQSRNEQQEKNLDLERRNATKNQQILHLEKKLLEYENDQHTSDARLDDVQELLLRSDGILNQLKQLEANQAMMMSNPPISSHMRRLEQKIEKKIKQSKKMVTARENLLNEHIKENRNWIRLANEAARKMHHQTASLDYSVRDMVSDFNQLIGRANQLDAAILILDTKVEKHLKLPHPRPAAQPRGTGRASTTTVEPSQGKTEAVPQSVFSFPNIPASSNNPFASSSPSTTEASIPPQPGFTFNPFSQNSPQPQMPASQTQPPSKPIFDFGNSSNMPTFGSSASAAQPATPSTGQNSLFSFGVPENNAPQGTDSVSTPPAPTNELNEDLYFPNVPRK